MPPRDSERRFVLHDHTTNSNEQANWTVPLRYYRTTTPVHRRRTTPPSPPLIMAQPIHPSSVLTVTAATTAAAFVASTLHGDKDKKLPAGTQKATMVSILCHPQRIWELHIMISCLVLLVGILQNHNTRKYFPIEPSQIGEHCERAFLNALSLSVDDAAATVCCTAQTVSDLCYQMEWPLVKRLTRFPEAWLLPLVPWICSGLFLVQQQTVKSFPSTYMWRRLGLYTTIMIFRGFVLYQGMNYIEDRLVRIHHQQEGEVHNCWYQNLLRPDQSSCYGRAFDFSDHVVLYFAQIIPIALWETIIGFITVTSLQSSISSSSSAVAAPLLVQSSIRKSSSLTVMYRSLSSNFSDDGKQQQQQLQLLDEHIGGGGNSGAVAAAHDDVAVSYPSHERRRMKKMVWFIPQFLMLAIVFYLYLITMWSAYRTAAFFHTPGEIITGWILSCAIQLPLYALFQHRSFWMGV